jgi:protease-4
MKNFWTSMLGSLAALVIFAAGALVVVLGLIGIAVALGGGERQPSFAKGSYLVFDLATAITDGPGGLDLGSLPIPVGGLPKTIQLHEVTRALRLAANDNRVAGVFLKGSLGSAGAASGFATLREVRNALAAVRAAGKPVRAYLTNAGTGDYYVASAGSDVVLDPFGVLELPGLASEPMFFAQAFEKYGVGIQVTRVGKYKSAIEPFTRSDMSPESREQLQKLLGDIWTDVVAQIAESRKLTPEQLQALVDTEGMLQPAKAKEAKLIDRSAYLDEVIADLIKETGPAAGTRKTFKQIDLADYAKLATGPAGPGGVAKANDGSSSSRGKIALVYAEGEIVDGEGSPGSIGGARYAREIRQLRQDSSVKAIVLRINSPGGSATASEAIQRELRLAREAKPVIVSMGDYAASGGYWIAAYGDHLFAQPGTITGSIGVFGVQFDIEKLAKDFGVTFDRVKTGQFADTATISRPKTPAELAVVQKLVDWIYGEFIRKVSEGRKLPTATVEEIAQGRVWSGTEAKRLGLVDEIGGLGAALAYTATKAGLGANYQIQEFPVKSEFSQLLQQMLDDLAPLGARAGRVQAPQARLLQGLGRELKVLESLNDPQGVYARLPFGLGIR